MIGSAAADEDPDGANGADVELLAAAAAGDVTAFELLYGRFTLHAHRVARSICRDHGRAEEAVQEAFMAVWNLGHLYDPARGPVTAWLLAIVRHKALDAARRNDRHARRRADDGGGDARTARGEIHDRIVAREYADRLSSHLERLPAAQQEVIRLAFYGQLTHIEIAERLNLPEGTVKGRARLGLQKLRTDSSAFSADG